MNREERIARGVLQKNDIGRHVAARDLTYAGHVGPPAGGANTMEAGSRRHGYPAERIEEVGQFV